MCREVVGILAETLAPHTENLGGLAVLAPNCNFLLLWTPKDSRAGLMAGSQVESQLKIQN